VPSARPDDDGFPDLLDRSGVLRLRIDADQPAWRVEDGPMRVFAMGGVGAALLTVTAAVMPARTLVLAPEGG
jgi:hypothetical protein